MVIMFWNYIIIYHLPFKLNIRVSLGNILIAFALTAYNKAYALHSLAVVRAAPNRGGKAAATSHKQNVRRHTRLQSVWGLFRFHF